MLRVPISTYRLQLHKDFTFDKAAEVADYLRALGVSHIYCSPYLQAAPGSQHGYDVVSHQQVNDELGGHEAHDRFSARLKELGMGQVLDIVPNHMSLGKENRYWWDVLENGASSRYASFFDIDWQQAEDRLHEVGITVNRNAVPNDPRPPMVTSGLRIGTPALATRGFGADEFTEVADIIAEALKPGDVDIDGLRKRAAVLAERFPLYPNVAPFCG